MADKPMKPEDLAKDGTFVDANGNVQLAVSLDSILNIVNKSKPKPSSQKLHNEKQIKGTPKPKRGLKY